MSDAKPIKTSDEVVINLQPLLMPLSIILSAVIIAGSLLIGLNNIALKVSGTTTTATGTSSSTSSTAVTPVTLDQVKNLFADQSIIKFGDPNSKALVIEFSDPSCPYCHIAGGKHPELNAQSDRFKLVQDGGTYDAPVPEFKKLLDEGKIAFAWVYSNGHGNGEMGTRALYCANEKGKFWEAHDLLMSKSGYDLLNDTVQNDKSKSGQLADFLNSVIPSADMKSCLDSGKYDSRLTTDQTIANSFQVSGTPGFFINTVSYPGAYNYTDMKATVDSALQ